MRRDGWHGIVDSTAACQRRPGAGAGGDVRAAEENFMIRSLTPAEARNNRTQTVIASDPAGQEGPEDRITAGTTMPRGHRPPRSGTRMAVRQLTRLGVPWSLAHTVADHVDWRQVARLVQHGCPSRLALDIVR
jgi:hypothetical protein